MSPAYDWYKALLADEKRRFELQLAQADKRHAATQRELQSLRLRVREDPIGPQEHTRRADETAMLKERYGRSTEERWKLRHTMLAEKEAATLEVARVERESEKMLVENALLRSELAGLQKKMAMMAAKDAPAKGGTIGVKPSGSWRALVPPEDGKEEQEEEMVADGDAKASGAAIADEDEPQPQDALLAASPPPAALPPSPPKQDWTTLSWLSSVHGVHEAVAAALLHVLPRGDRPAVTKTPQDHRIERAFLCGRASDGDDDDGGDKEAADTSAALLSLLKDGKVAERLAEALWPAVEALSRGQPPPEPTTSEEQLGKPDEESDSMNIPANVDATVKQDQEEEEEDLSAIDGVADETPARARPEFVVRISTR